MLTRLGVGFSQQQFSLSNVEFHKYVGTWLVHELNQYMSYCLYKIRLRQQFALNTQTQNPTLGGSARSKWLV